ncbi:MAG TPA: signal peptidase II [Roseiarcus sp.]|nr:signal peptidase II [Roseiarcus sp.]
MQVRTLGGLTILSVLVLDQASKVAVVRYFDGNGGAPFALAPFLDFTLRWNRGISFSLFAQESAVGPWLLLALTLAVTALLGFWLWRARAPLVGLGLGAIIGGALGNGYDRLAYGAVADFLDLHAFGRHFFVFNLADAAINIGVALLIFDGLFGSAKPNVPGPSPERPS